MTSNASQSLIVLAENLEQLMQKTAGLDSQSAIGRAAKVDQKTIGRLLAKAHEPRLDVIAKIAKAYGLQPWQLLVPNLDPKNPPMLAEVAENERRLWAKAKEAAAELAGLEKQEAL